jgi:hypothetical protein
MPKAAALLNETLQEEVKADKLLTQIGATKATGRLARRDYDERAESPSCEFLPGVPTNKAAFGVRRGMQ